MGNGRGRQRDWSSFNPYNPMRATKIIAFLVVLFLLFLGVQYAVEGSERADCVKWATFAETTEGYYLTEWQEMQCRALDVNVHAPTIAPCNDWEARSECQTRLGDKWEVIYYPITGETRGERYTYK
jgi:hypothetical protein